MSNRDRLKTMDTRGLLSEASCVRASAKAAVTDEERTAYQLMLEETLAEIRIRNETEIRRRADEAMS